jgi:RNase P subunit RPR2
MNVNEKRMNFLLQASLLTQNTPSLSRYYRNLNKDIAKKLVKRQERDVKSPFCKECNTVYKLEKIRVKRGKLVDSCHVCNKKRIKTIVKNVGKQDVGQDVQRTKLNK